jgi:phage regulator Rha-like protein
VLVMNRYMKADLLARFITTSIGSKMAAWYGTLQIIYITRHCGAGAPLGDQQRPNKKGHERMPETTQETNGTNELATIVILKKGEVFTTSEIVAVHADIQHESIVRQITNNMADFESFGKVGFSDLKSGNLGGRPRRIYKLNEQQATFLLTLLDNSLPVKRFKRELVEQFYQMREKLQYIEAARRECRSLTDAVMLAHEDPKAYVYTNEHDMIYRVVLGQSAKQYRVAHSLPDGENIRPYLSVHEIAAVQALQGIDAGLVLAGLPFGERKVKLTDAYQRFQQGKQKPVCAEDQKQAM